MPHPDSAAFHQSPDSAAGVVAAGADARLAVHWIAPGTLTALWKTPLASMLAALDPYPTNMEAPATFGVATLFRMLTDWLCDVSTPVRYACIVEAETAVRCPFGSTCARTHTIAPSSCVAAAARFVGKAPLTRLDGACANTKMLPLDPTSWGRAWIVALTLAVVGVTLPVTAIGKTGDAAATLAVKVPVIVCGAPSLSKPFSVRAPLATPSHDPVMVHVVPGPIW